MSESMQYLGFDVNGEACEIFAGEAFETHLPSRNEIVVRTAHGEAVAGVGDRLVKDGQDVDVAAQPSGGKS